MRQADLNRVNAADWRIKEFTDTINKNKCENITSLESYYLKKAKEFADSHMDDIINIQKQYHGNAIQYRQENPSGGTI